MQTDKCGTVGEYKIHNIVKNNKENTLQINHNFRLNKLTWLPRKLQDSWAIGLGFQILTAKQGPLNNQEFLSLYAF